MALGRLGTRLQGALGLILALTLGIVARPLPADAQQPAKIARIGLLSPLSASAWSSPLFQALQ